LLDKEMTETLNKIPGLANIPLLGKLFQSRTKSKDTTELLVIVTPEVVRPLQVGQPVPELKYPEPFMEPNSAVPMHQPGIDKTGPVVEQHLDNIPIEQLVQQPKQGQAAPAVNQQTAPAPPTPNPVQPPPLGAASGGKDE
jgi:pilus assembly protein CpaC